MSNELTRLRQFIVEHYSLDELRELCYELELLPDELREGGISDKAQDFLLLASRKRLLEALIRAIDQDKYRGRLLRDAGLSPDAIRPEKLYDQLADLAFSWGLASRDLRIRDNVLQNVQSVWIEGFLKQSLHHAIALELNLAVQTDAVSRTWGVVLQQPGREEQPAITDQSLREIFESYGRSLLILGEPGSGKTIMLLQLAEQLIQDARLNPSLPVPVILNLSSWATHKKSLAEWLVEEIYLQYQLAKKLVRTWIEGNQMLYLLDGLDEVAEGSRDDCIAAINDFKSQYPAEMVVSSRTADYEKLSNRLNLATAVRIQPLTDAQINDYLGRKELELQEVHAMLASDSDIKELAHSPLMLNIMTLAYRGLTGDSLRSLEGAEGRRQHLFRTYIKSMFDRRPLSDDSRFDKEQALAWLSNLANFMGRHSESVFYIERLQPTWLPEVKHRQHMALTGLLGGLLGGLSDGLSVGLSDGLSVGLRIGLSGVFGIALSNWYVAPIPGKWRRFIIGGLGSWLIGGLVVGLSYGLSYVLIGGLSVMLSVGLRYVMIGGLEIGLSDGLIFGLIGGFVAYRSNIETIETITLQRPSRQRLLRGIRQGLIIGLIIGLIFGLIDGLIFGLRIGLIDGLRIGLIDGLSDGLVGGLGGGLIGGLMTIIQPRAVAQKLHPNQGIQSSLKTTMRLSLVATLLVGLFSWSLDRMFQTGPLFLFGLLSYVFPIVFLYFAGLAVIQHYTLRLLLNQYNILPRRLVPFLDNMKDRILLRHIGGGYVFIHRMLMEYLAEHEIN